MIFYSTIIAIAFVVVTYWGEGGSKFRYIGKKAGGFFEKYTEELAKLSDDFYDFVEEKKKDMSKGRKLIGD